MVCSRNKGFIVRINRQDFLVFSTSCAEQDKLKILNNTIEKHETVEPRLL